MLAKKPAGDKRGLSLRLCPYGVCVNPGSWPEVIVPLEFAARNAQGFPPPLTMIFRLSVSFQANIKINDSSSSRPTTALFSPPSIDVIKI